MPTITVAVVDAHPVCLEGIEHFLSAAGNFRLIGVGTCAEDAVSLVQAQAPDVLIVDLNVPGDELLSLVQITSTSATKVIVFTAIEVPERAVLALKSGAHAYVLKRSAMTEITHAIDSTMRGRTYISPEFAGQVIVAASPVSPVVGVFKNALSDREERIVRMLLCGKNNREMATTLGLSEKTVKSYMTVLMQKLNAKSRLEVVMVMQRRQQAAAHAHLSLETST